MHYLTDTNNESKTLPGNVYRISDFLYFYQATTGAPNTYTFEVLASNYASIGNHVYILHVGLELYPTATEARVTWSVMVNPCIVTSYIPPADYTWNYAVGNLASNYIFTFNQVPCRYSQKFTALLSTGATLPKSMTLSQTGEGYFRVYATNTTDIGNYEVVITGTLDNINVFGDPSSTISPELRISKTNPPANFVYTSKFSIFLNIVAAPISYSQPNNTSPFFVPKPGDVWFYATDSFARSFGPAFDNEGDKVEVIPDFGNAARFVLWDKASNTMSVPANATTSNEIGDYYCSIYLTDNKKTNVAYSSATFIGNVTYYFRMTIFPKIATVAPTQKPPDVRLEQVFVENKNTSVIDVRTFDRNAIFNATDTTVIKSAAPQVANSN